MGILQFTPDTPAQVGVLPRTVKMVTTDDLATVTTASYLNNYTLEGQSVYTTDVFEVIYGFNQATQVGTFGTFLPTISNGVITLELQANTGTVNTTDPTTLNAVPFWDSVNGDLSPSGLTRSNLSGFTIPMASTPTVTGRIATYSDTSGSLNNPNISPSDSSLNKLASISASGNTVGHIVTIKDANGSVQDGGFVPVEVLFIGVSGGGGAASQAVSVTGAAVGNVPIFVGNAVATTNNVAAIGCYVSNPDEVTIIFTADPGIFSGTIVLFKHT